MPLCSHGRSFTSVYNLPVNLDVYVYLRRLDKESLTNVSLGEDLIDLDELLSENPALFWYLCLTALYTI